MRRLFLARSVGVALAGVFGATAPMAQQSKKLPRVAYVWIFWLGPSAPFEAAFREELRKLGWIEGGNIAVDVRDAEGDPEKLAAIMRDLVDAKVDVITTSCTPEALVAAKYTSTIPIVVAASGDLVASGLVTSLARPGGNVTGISGMSLDLSAKRLAILKEAFPSIARATVLFNPLRKDNVPEVKAMQTAATSLGVRLDAQEVRTPVEIRDVLDILPTTGTQALLNAGDAVLASETAALIAFCAKWRLPSIFENRRFVDHGALMSYGPNLEMMHRRAANYVDKILRGAKPAEISIEQPTKFELVINMKTARALGITVPASLLTRADTLIQ